MLCRIGTCLIEKEAKTWDPNRHLVATLQPVTGRGDARPKD